MSTIVRIQGDILILSIKHHHVINIAKWSIFLCFQSRINNFKNIIIITLLPFVVVVDKQLLLSIEIYIIELKWQIVINRRLFKRIGLGDILNGIGLTIFITLETIGKSY